MVMVDGDGGWYGKKRRQGDKGTRRQGFGVGIAIGIGIDGTGKREKTKWAGPLYFRPVLIAFCPYPFAFSLPSNHRPSPSPIPSLWPFAFLLWPAGDRGGI